MKRFINDLKKHHNYAVYSAKAALKAEVASSYLNWIWWVLEPLCMMLIYAFIFGVVFSAREDYFPIFIFIGITCWDFFSKNMNQSVKMVKKNKPIVTKVYLPKFVLILTRMYVNGFKMLISWGIVLIMVIFFRVPLTWHIIYVIPLMITLWLVTFGFMCILLHFGVFVDDLSNIITIVLRLVFYLTGIFYNIETRLGDYYPALAKVVGEANPMAFIIIGFRKAVLYGQSPNGVVLLLWILIAIAVSVIGVRTIYKNENNYVKVI